MGVAQPEAGLAHLLKATAQVWYHARLGRQGENHGRAEDGQAHAARLLHGAVIVP